MENFKLNKKQMVTVITSYTIFAVLALYALPAVANDGHLVLVAIYIYNPFAMAIILGMYSSKHGWKTAMLLLLTVVALIIRIPVVTYQTFFLIPVDFVIGAAGMLIGTGVKIMISYFERKNEKAAQLRAE